MNVVVVGLDTINRRIEKMEDNDICYECSTLGGDYFLNKDGEWECFCPYCPVGQPDDS